jgi:hypothetical protein
MLRSSSVGGSSPCKGVKFNGVKDALGLKSNKEGIQQRPPGKKKSVAKKSNPDVKTRCTAKQSLRMLLCYDKGVAVKKSKQQVIFDCDKQKQVKKQCSFKGCTNKAQTGGVCVTHGATKKRCSHKGCTNGVIKNGVCVTHGARKKRCSYEGCTNQAIKGGVCVTHGATKKRCSHKGCTNHAKKGGVCWTHGAKVNAKLCSHDGCSSYCQKGGVCYRHRSRKVSTHRTTLEPNAVPPVPHNQVVDYEDEEELNSWIWRSQAHIKNNVPGPVFFQLQTMKKKIGSKHYY